MKRLFFMFIAVIAFNVGIMAQDSQVATLQHGTRIRAYYGPNALKEAYADASDGDIITLTAGEFNSGAMAKAITIRGEGATKTTIVGNKMSLTIPQGSQHTLYFEGLNIKNEDTWSDGWMVSTNYSIYISGTDGTEKVVLSKCRVSEQSGSSSTLSFSKCSATVVQSEVTKSISSNNAKVACINSIVRSLSSANSNSRFDIQNCVITETPNVQYSSIKNSIVCGICSINSETNTTSHCLLKEGSSGFSESWYVKTETDPDPWGELPVVLVWDDLFAEDYHLTEEASKTYHGTDGTEVGIYGGIYPYNVTPDIPVVKKLDVIGNYQDGKLNIKINVE